MLAYYDTRGRRLDRNGHYIEKIVFHIDMYCRKYFL